MGSNMLAVLAVLLTFSILSPLQLYARGGDDTAAEKASCTGVVAKLNGISLRPGDATVGFVRNQTCIANDCCSDQTIQAPQWINTVVPDFVNPFLNKDGLWKRVIDVCHALPPELYGRDEVCQAHMAAYHIAWDLSQALYKDGCGTDKDWRTTGEIIASCVKKGVFSDWGPLTPVVKWCANRVVQKSRDAVRLTCRAYRRE